MRKYVFPSSLISIYWYLATQFPYALCFSFHRFPSPFICTYSTTAPQNARDFTRWPLWKINTSFSPPSDSDSNSIEYGENSPQGFRAPAQKSLRRSPPPMEIRRHSRQKPPPPLPHGRRSRQARPSRAD